MKLLEEFNIAGKGKVIAARLDKDEGFPRAGFYLKWEGADYVVTSVEVTRKNFSVDRSVGLIVREVKDYMASVLVPEDLKLRTDFRKDRGVSRDGQ